jgi:hypothetical protein
MNHRSQLLIFIFACSVAFVSCKPEETPDPGNPGHNNPPQGYVGNYTGERWVIFKKAFPLVSDTIPANDTLVFFSDTECLLAGDSITYRVYGNIGLNTSHFELNGTTYGNLITANGGGAALPVFDSSGIANQVLMNADNGNVWYFWFKKIQ